MFRWWVLLRFKRDEGFRYVFKDPVHCQFKIIEVNKKIYKGSGKARAIILDISKEGAKIETNLNMTEKVVGIVLQINFNILVTEYIINCDLIWGKPYGKHFVYGLKFKDGYDSVKLTNDLKNIANEKEEKL